MSRSRRRGRTAGAVRTSVRAPSPHPSGAEPPSIPTELVPHHVAIIRIQREHPQVATKVGEDPDEAAVQRDELKPDPANPKIITSFRSIGYRFESPPS